MAKDPLLRDAVRAIKAKIETAAEIATPEELAYLGTAIDRIGGRATVLEVEEMGDVKMAEMSAHANAVESATLNTIATDAESFITATKASAEASVTQTKDAALAVMAQTETSTVATVNAAAQTAIQQAAAAANSVTQQLVLGRKTFFLAQL